MCSHLVQASYHTPTCEKRNQAWHRDVSDRQENQTKQENSCLRNISIKQKFLTTSLNKDNNHWEST